MSWKDRLRRWFNTSSFDEKTHLFKGVPRPTTTLAHMIVSKILTSDLTCVDKKSFEVGGLTISWAKRKTVLCNDRELDYEQCERLCSKYNTKSRSSWAPSDLYYAVGLRNYVLEHYNENDTREYVINTHPDVVFNDAEMLILDNGIKKATHLKKEREKIAEYSDNQQKAVDIIEKFLNVPKETEEEKCSQSIHQKSSNTLLDTESPK